jgi:hypothetical protein
MARLIGQGHQVAGMNDLSPELEQALQHARPQRPQLRVKYGERSEN